MGHRYVYMHRHNVFFIYIIRIYLSIYFGNSDCVCLYKLLKTWEKRKGITNEGASLFSLIFMCVCLNNVYIYTNTCSTLKARLNIHIYRIYILPIRGFIFTVFSPNFFYLCQVQFEHYPVKCSLILYRQKILHKKGMSLRVK